MAHRMLALASCLLSFTCVSLAEEPMAPLQGYVFAEGKPLAGATVVLLNESGEVPRSTTDLLTEPHFIAGATTDVNGYFLFFEVPNGKLSLHVSESGFLPGDQSIEFFGPPVTVHIDLFRGTVGIPKGPPVAAEEETIFYATDRKPSGSVDPGTFYTNERSSEDRKSTR